MTIKKAKKVKTFQGARGASRPHRLEDGSGDDHEGRLSRLQGLLVLPRRRRVLHGKGLARVSQVEPVDLQIR